MSQSTSSNEGLEMRQEIKPDSPAKIENIRKHVKVLAIINYVRTDFDSKPYFLEGLEDFSSAMFLRHVFHYKFGIPNNQILITSLDENSFDIIKNKSSHKFGHVSHQNEIEPLISNQNYHLISPIKDKMENNRTEEESKVNYRYKYFPMEIFDTMFNQVDDLIYKFNPDQDLPNTVHPFNRHELKSLNITSEDDLFVFTIDHGSKGSFANYPFEHIFERLLELNPKHITIFNDSCYSGSLVDFTQKSHDFQKNLNEATKTHVPPKTANTVHNLLAIYKKNRSLLAIIMTILFFILILLTVAHPSIGFTLFLIWITAFFSSYFKMLFIDFSDVPESILNDVKKIVSLALKNPLGRESLLKFVEPNNENPSLFAQLGEISDIFCSTNSECVASSFPIQETFTSKDMYGSYGTILISSIIYFLLENESFGDKEPPTKEAFLHLLEEIFNNTKARFHKILMLQNQQSNLLNDFLNQKQIPHYFSQGDSLFLFLQKAGCPATEFVLEGISISIIEYPTDIPLKVLKRPIGHEYGPVEGQNFVKKLCEDFGKASDRRLKYFVLRRIHFSDYFSKREQKAQHNPATSAYFLEFRKQIDQKLRANQCSGYVYLFPGIEWMIDRYLSLFPLFPSYFVKCLADAFNDIWDDWRNVPFICH